MKQLNLFIDADDTLLDFDVSETKAITQTLKDYDILSYNGIIESYKRNNLKAWKLFEKGGITRDDISTMRFKWVFSEFNIQGIDLNKINTTYWNYLAKQAYVIDGAEDFLKHVYGKHNLYVVTNGTAFIQDSRFALSGLDKYFKSRYISENLNTRKPEKAFFDYIEKDIKGLNKETSYVIGDSLSSDIQLGINAGVKTIWFNREEKQNNKDIEPTYEVRDFYELSNLIDRLSEE